MSAAARLLIIEDERDIARVLADLLRAEGYHVQTATDGGSGLALALSENFDLIVLDLMLPGLSGMEICQRLRSHRYAGGILMLTAKGRTADQVTGFRTGADDYVVKPFVPDEITARIAALLRRVRSHRSPATKEITFGQISADFSRNHFTCDGQPIALSAKEAALLHLLINHEGTILSRETLLQQIWPSQPHITPRTVDVHIAWLRKKIELSPDTPKHILTERGVGYRFEASGHSQ